MFPRKRNLIQYTGDSAIIAEYVFLNNMTIMRIDTAHYVWFGSIIAEGVIITLGLQHNCSTLVCFSILLMIPFILSIAFQLKYICKIRTYISVFISPKLNIRYDQFWVPSKKAAFILLLPYAIYSVICLVLALNTTTPFDSFLHMNKNFKTILSDNLEHLIVWSIANIFLLIFAIYLIGSTGQRVWKQYLDDWKRKKYDEEIVNFENEFMG